MALLADPRKLKSVTLRFSDHCAAAPSLLAAPPADRDLSIGMECFCALPHSLRMTRAFETNSKPHFDKRPDVTVADQAVVARRLSK